MGKENWVKLATLNNIKYEKGFMFFCKPNPAGIIEVYKVAMSRRSKGVKKE